MDRAAIEVEDLLKVVLVLIVVLLALEVVDVMFDLLTGILGLFKPIVALLVAALIVLWLLDRI